MKSKRAFATAVLLSFAAVFLLCSWTANAMYMDDTVSICVPHEKATALCQASPRAHILAWQNFMSIVPQSGAGLLIALLLAGAIFTVRGKLRDDPVRIQSSLRHWKTRLRDAPPIIDPIRRALSRGIIEPQIYVLSTS